MRNFIFCFMENPSVFTIYMNFEWIKVCRLIIIYYHEFLFNFKIFMFALSSLIYILKYFIFFLSNIKSFLMCTIFYYLLIGKYYLFSIREQFSVFLYNCCAIILEKRH